MKKVFLIAILVGQIGIAQEAGKIGELLRNEATSGEMYKQKMDWEYSGKTTRRYDYQRERTTTRTNNYRWNLDFGYTEIFLRIPEEGYFTIKVADQVMSNASGKFRFFDVNAGRVPISIYENGFLIYRTHILAQNNTRTVLDFFTAHGLYLLSVYPVGNQQYGINDWNDIWNNPYHNNRYIGNVMPDVDFNNFVRAMENISAFDDARIDFVNQQINNTDFTSHQIRIILDKISFEKKKLALAQRLYPICVDKNNFYIVYDSFTFDSYKRDLMKFVSQYR